MKKPAIPRLGGLLAVLATAQAAPVTWTTGPTSTASEASIIIPTGATIYHAGTWGTGTGSGPLTVPVTGDSIIFENMLTGAAIGTNTAIATGGEFSNGDVWVPPGASDANFQNVMDGFAGDGGNPKNVILGGLVAGKQYQVQIFVSDDRSCCSGRTMEWSDNATDNAGNETATFTAGSSSYVIGTFTADGPTQTIYGRGVAQTQNYLNAYVLLDLSADTDGDKIPDHIEDTYPFLSSANAADAALDQDSDGLSNLLEYRKGLSLTVADHDGDGLNDGVEVNTYNSNPKVTDTDGDTLSDGAEVNIHNSSPTSLDSDSDLFPDRWEAAAGSQLDSNTSTPNGTQASILGVNAAALLGFDLTDPDGNGNDTTNTGFDWVSISSSQGGDPSSTGEGSGGNVFDNKVGGGEAKWCCNGAPQHVTVEFAAYTSLQHFTITSSNDAPERDPRVWEIQGSNDNIHFAPITRFDFTPAAIWTARNQVVRINLPANSQPYKYIRYQVYSSGSTLHALGEIEYFGTQNNNDGDSDGIPQLFEVLYPGVLSDSDPADADLDADSDGLTNLEEFQAGTGFQDADTDDDGLNDGDEVEVHFTDPFKADMDGDGLTDGAEINTHNSSPTLVDTDGDYFKDGYEVAEGSDPNSSSSTPFGVTVQAEGTLLGSDITDRDNNGSDATLAGSGFDWTSITASSKADFAPAEGAFNVFDNKTGGGEAKWCCDPAPQSITVEMPYGVQLTHFTLTSSNDSPERDPRAFAIQGSNDGTNFTDIFNHTDSTMSFFGATRNQTMRFDLATPAPMYRWFRYSVTATGSATQHALAEIEYFGIEQDSDSDGLPDYFEAQYGVANPGDDSDSDGLTNLQEYEEGTAPNDSDTDNDGLTDGSEINTHNTSPTARDSDNDQIPDGYEVTHGGDPTNSLTLPTFAPIDWAAPANITGNLSDFKTTRTLVHAWTGGTAPINVPGVANFTAGPSLGASHTGFDPYNRNLNADYETLIDTGSYSGSLGRFIEIPNLTPGEDYRVQIWVADTRSGTADRTYRYGNAGDEQVTLEAGAFGNEAAKPGQWVTGTFTAIDTAQFLFMDSATVAGAQYNALTVYQDEIVITTPLQVIATGFNGAAFEMTVTGFDTGKTYQLRRSTTLSGFSNVGAAFTPAGTTQVVSDPAPPAGKAFYMIQDVP